MSTVVAGALAVTPLYATPADAIVSWDDPGQTWRSLGTLGAVLGPGGGGTGTSTVFTAGSVVFAGAGGVYAQDNANLFWDDAANRLGIGTASPATKLDAVGTIRSTGATTPAAGAGVELFYTGSVGYLVSYDRGGAAGHQLYLSGSSIALMDGNVGIGTAAPGAKLSIGNNLASGFLDTYAEYQILLYDGSTASSSYGFGVQNTGTLMYQAGGGHRFDSGGTATLAAFNASGTQNVSGVWGVISGREMKQEIAPYERGLDALVQLQPVVFRYRAGTPFARAGEASKLLIGLIADEVQPHVPEIVGEITTMVGEKSDVAMSTLEPGLLVFALINSVKTLAARNDELSARIEALEARP